MEQLTKNQAVATSQEAVQNQNEPQLRDENAHNDKSVHGVLNPTYQAGLRRDAVDRKSGSAGMPRPRSTLFPYTTLFRSNKKSDMDLAAKGLGAKEWNNSLKTKLSLLPKKLFRIRMSRNFGMKMLTMTNLSTECLIQLTKLGYDATPFNQILKQNAKR